MRSLILTLLSVGLFSCNSETKVNQESSSNQPEQKVTPDFNVALSFINDYTKLCTSPQRTPTAAWIKQNSLLTDNFKNRYHTLMDSADKKDPELGLDSDPIFDAQDFPEKGFSILRVDTAGGYVTVAGNDWKEFELVLRVALAGSGSLVDGAGVINIPNDKRAKR